MPTMMATRPSAKVRFPGQSRRAVPRRGTSRRLRYAHTVPNRPKGTDTRKISRHWIGASTPPRTRPRNEPLIADTWFTPMAMPRWSGGNASVRMAEELAISRAAPTPWKTRMMTSHSAAAVPLIQVRVSTSEKNV